MWRCITFSPQVRAYHSADCTPSLQRSFSATPRRRKSAAVTPHRRISAATFEEGCRSPILRQETDGSMSFLNVPPVSFGRTRDLQSDTSASYNSPRAGAGLSKDDLSLSNIPAVHDNLTSDMNHHSLCFKVAKNFSMFSSAASTTVLQVKGVGSKTFLLGSAVKVTKDTSPEEADTALALPVELQTYLIGVLNGRKSITISSQHLKERFGDISFLEYEQFDTLAIILLFDVEEKIQGMALLSLGEKNAKNILENKLISDIAKLSGICMKNASDFQSMRLELTRSQVFLELARVIFDNQMSIEFTVLKMLVNFLNLIECERAQILLSSKDEPTTFNKVYDLEDNDLKRDNFEGLLSPFENR